VNGGPLPDWIDPGVVFERRLALQWLVDEAAPDWDDVEPHT
jgi:hypothetical protein